LLLEAALRGAGASFLPDDIALFLSGMFVLLTREAW
jgi:hypothetical protein